MPAILTLTLTRGLSYLMAWNGAPEALGAGVAGPWAGPDTGKTRPFQETESEIQKRTGSLAALGRDSADTGWFPCEFCQARLEFYIRQDLQATRE